MKVENAASSVTGLSRDYYVSEDIFEREQDVVFPKLWFFVGMQSQIPQAGDYFVRQIGRESVIIVRDGDGAVRAFFNVCRHRGFQVCEPNSSGHARQFVCPYHAWSYGLDGRLRSAPGSKDGVDFDFDEFGLQEAHCDFYFGSIFIKLASKNDEVAPLIDMIDTSTESVLREVCPEKTKVVHEELYTIKANWKLILENNLECHHCGSSHPELNRVINPKGFFASDGDDGAVEDVNAQTVTVFPFRKGMKTLSADGNWVCRKPLGMGFVEGFSVGYAFAPPYNAVAYFSDHGIAASILPVDKDTSVLLTQWYVHEDAVEGVDYNAQDVAAFLDLVNRQDVVLPERNQRGVNSAFFVPGPHSASREGALRPVLDSYLELLNEARPTLVEA